MAHSPEYFKEYYRKNRDKYLERAKRRYAERKAEKHAYDAQRRLLKGEELRAYDRARYMESRRGTAFIILQRVRQRAMKKGIPFDLTEDDIHIPDVCPVLGIPLAVSDKKGGKWDSPSLDRLRPELGYVKGNVVVISKRANTIKSDASLDEIEAVAAWLRSSFSGNAASPSS